MNKFLFSFWALLLCTTGHTQINIPSDTISIAVYGGRLYGTLLQPNPSKDRPIVLIIAGSGPTDRNGNNPLSGKNNCLLQLADSLAQYGIATLRYDKRGIGESVQSLAKEENLVFEQNTADARCWLQYLTENGFRKIYVAGHSEGSLVALQVAQGFPLSGLISLAGAGRSIQDVLREQLSTLPESLKENTYRCVDSLSAGKRVNNPPLALLSLFRPSVQDYLISWMKLDPAKLVAKLNCPILIVQGERDLQVSVADANRLAQANPKAELFILPTMNHLFKSVASDQLAENLNTYKDPTLPVMSELIQRMTIFLR